VDEPSKNQPKITLVAKSYLLTDVRHGFSRRRQQYLRLGNPKMIEITYEGLAGDVLEKAHEIRFAHSQHRSNVPEPQWLAVIAPQEFEERLKALQGALPSVENIDRAVIRGIVIDQQNQDHFQIRFDGQASALGVGGEFRVDALE
jgi:hypothetical protein